MILDTVRAIAPKRSAFARPGVAPLSFGALAEGASARVGWRGRRLAVLCEDDRTAAAVLVLADGAAQCLLLCPSEVSDDLIAGFLERAEVGLVVTDRPDRLPGGVETRVAESAEALLEPDAGCGEAEPVTTQWMIPTSGTTGTPKLIMHTLRSLTWSTKRDLERGRDVVWGLTYGITRFAGLQVFFQSLLSGSTLAIPAPGADLERRIEAFVELGCTAISATPSLWRRILMAPAATRMRLRQITLGGEIADEAILRALRQAWPEARIVHIFASTEAGVGMAVADGHAGFPAAWLEAPPPGLEIGLSERETLLLKPAAAEQRMLGRADSLYDERGFIDTGDRLRREGDRYYFLGREDGAINVGGNKVHPEEIEHVLVDCPGVRLALVRGRPNPITGMLVEAQVVQDPDQQADSPRRKAIQGFCRERLENYKVPALIRFVDAIEFNPSGKQVRK